MDHYNMFFFMLFGEKHKKVESYKPKMHPKCASQHLNRVAGYAIIEFQPLVVLCATILYIGKDRELSGIFGTILGA
jgi:hypothetical protein